MAQEQDKKIGSSRPVTRTTKGKGAAATTTATTATKRAPRSATERNAAMRSAISRGKAKPVAPPKKKPQGLSKATKRNISIIAMLVICAVSVYVLLASIDYIMGWEQNQSAIESGSSEVLNNKLKNDTGRLGAIISKVIISDWFGIFGVMLPASLLILSFFLVYRKNLLFLRVSLSVVTGMVIWATAATFFTPDMNGIYGTSLGGGFGLVMVDYLHGYFGDAGCLLLIIVAAFLWSIYTFPKSLIIFESIYKAVLFVLTFIFLGKNKNKAKESTTTVEGTDVKGSEAKSKPTTIKKPSFKQVKDEDTLDDMLDILGSGSSDNDTSDDDIPLTIDIPKEEGDKTYNFGATTTDEKERAGTHRDDMNKDNFEIVIGSDTAIVKSKDGNSIITTSESDALNPDDIDQTLFDPTRELSRYQMPPFELLEDRQFGIKITEAEIHENKERIINTLRNFSIDIQSIKATVGPTVTLYEIVPAVGVRISKIKNLEDDIALSLSALGIRIIAPMPGKGTIGIEVPNKSKEVVSMFSAITSAAFQDNDADLPMVLGRTIQNQNFVLDLAKMPHVLVAGATGQGKSVGLNAIITSLLYKKHPSELKLVMIDPKKVELSLYSHLENHYLAKMEDEPESIITDTQRVIYTLNSLCVEMDDRYELLKTAKVKNIKEYNTKFCNRRLNPEKGHKFMPYIVVVIDEFADLIMTAGKEIETPIARIAQLARAVGIHLIIATQRPAANVITGVIKANFPARIAFRVMTSIDSKIILDSTGANQLIGRGDMLVSVGGEVTRVQCAFVDTPEIERIAEYIGDQIGFGSPMILPEYVPEKSEKDSDNGEVLSKRDGLFDEIARYVVTNQQGSASTIQRNFSIGFNRAGRIMDQLERAGIVGKQQGSKPREVRITDLSTLELLLYDLDNHRLNVE